jgi:Tol biopolymer transport system component
MRHLLKLAIALLSLQTIAVGMVVGGAHYMAVGEMIVFGAYTITSEDLILRDVSHGLEYNLTSSMDDSYEREPAWSPDGLRIVFTASSYTAYSPHLFVVDINGGNLRQVSDYVGFNPVWSPDGKHITFVTYQENGSINLFVMDADGNNVGVLTSSSTGGSSPTWSPDGRQIAFRSFPENAIYRMDADGGNKQLLIRGGYHNPAWSPDGTRIAFRSEEDNLLVMALGSSSLQSFSITGDLYGFTWLPDSHHIATVSERCFCVGSPEVYVLDISSGAEVRFPFGGFGGYVPVWRPS